MRMVPVILLSVLVLTGICIAGTTGKIAGSVLDAQTGDPLPGANVIVEGTNHGTAADLSGNYTLLNLSPGLYNLRISMIGYQEYVVENVLLRLLIYLMRVYQNMRLLLLNILKQFH